MWKDVIKARKEGEVEMNEHKHKWKSCGGITRAGISKRICRLCCKEQELISGFIYDGTSIKEEKFVWEDVVYEKRTEALCKNCGHEIHKCPDNKWIHSTIHNPINWCTKNNCNCDNAEQKQEAK
jgi:hypothetical protein